MVERFYAAAKAGAVVPKRRPFTKRAISEFALVFALDGSTRGQRDPDMALKEPRVSLSNPITTPREGLHEARLWGSDSVNGNEFQGTCEVYPTLSSFFCPEFNSC